MSDKRLATCLHACFDIHAVSLSQSAVNICLCLGVNTKARSQTSRAHTHKKRRCVACIMQLMPACTCQFLKSCHFATQIPPLPATSMAKEARDYATRNALSTTDADPWSAGDLERETHWFNFVKHHGTPAILPQAYSSYSASINQQHGYM